jgi:glycosyltransferase involved in cell wall biosynthesis
VRVSVIIPTHNEAQAIERVLADLPSDLTTEVIVVDSNSNDGTPEIAARMGARVVQEPRRGYGRACLTGLAAANSPDEDGHGRIVKITPEWRAYVLGATLLVGLTISSSNFGDSGGLYFMASLTLAGIVYRLAIREFFATARFSRHVVVIGLVLAAVWHIEFLRLPAGADDDIHRYVWDGRLQRLGYNPYIVVPSHSAVKRLHTPETRNLNNPDLPSPYPAGAQFFSAQ